MLAPIRVQTQDPSGGVGEFRLALEGQFIDRNTLGLSH